VTEILDVSADEEEVVCCTGENVPITLIVSPAENSQPERLYLETKGLPE
jgi:hypothetical protein